MIGVSVRLQTQTSSDNWQRHIFVLLQPSMADLCNQRCSSMITALVLRRIKTNKFQLFWGCFECFRSTWMYRYFWAEVLKWFTSHNTRVVQLDCNCKCIDVESHTHTHIYARRKKNKTENCIHQQCNAT